LGGGLVWSGVGGVYLDGVARVAVIGDQVFKKRGEGVCLAIERAGIVDSIYTMRFGLFV